MSCSSKRQQFSRLLIVEDNKAQRETLTDIFQEEGFDVVSCSTAAKSLEELQAYEFATAIVDLRLPDLDGIPLSRQIKTLSPETRVIVHTGFGSYETAKDAINLGVYAYVEKLSDPAELVKCVHQAITDRLSEALDSSQKAFQQLFDEAPVGYHELDTDGRIVRVNQTELEMLGYAVDEMLGHSVWEFCANSAEARAAVLAKLAGTAPPSQAFERDYRKKDGTLLPVLVEDRQLWDATGQIKGIRSTIQDITERQQMEKSLRQSEEQFRLLYERSPLAYQSLDEGGHILVVNPAWLEMLGYSRDEVIGRWIGEFLVPESVKNFHKNFPCFKETGAIHGAQFEMLCKDGNRITIEVDGKIGCDRQGHFQQTHCILRDITEQKQLERVLEKRTRQQAVAAELGQRALAGGNLTDLMNETAKRTAATLDVEFCNILEWLPGRDALLLRAGIGWKEGQVGRATVPAGRNSHAGYALQSDEAVIIKDWNCEIRFSRPPLLNDPNVISGVSVTIHGENGPWGILETYSVARRSFTKNDVSFLQTAANILADAIARQRAEDVLCKLSTSVEHSPASVMLTDCSGAIEYVNPKFTDVTGYRFEEVVGKNPRFLKSGHTSVEEYRVLWETILAGNVWRGEFHNKKKNGDLYWETASIAPIRGENERITHFVAVKEDITERKKTEETLRQREAELTHVARLSTLGEMVAGIAHEINQPLSAMANYAGACGMTLKARNDPAEQELIDWTNRIAEQAVRAGDIVRRLREFSRRSELQCDVCNVRESIVSAVELVTLITGCRDVMIDVGSIDSALNVRVDRVQLQQVLVNLLTNAFEAVQEVESHERRVRFESKAAGEFVEISIVDNGPGLPDENNGDLFNAFVTTKPEGVGMGLAICRSIVGTYDGRIWTTANRPQGAAFHFTLPQAS